MQPRDEFGRFVKTTEYGNETTNNSNNKENKTMMNKENRMETLKANGIATENFFDVNMKLPMGAMIQVTMPNGEVHKIGGNLDVSEFVPTFTEKEQARVNNYFSQCAQGYDPIAQQIMQSGYVKNTKLFRRFIAAHTFRLLGNVTCETKWNGEKVYRSGWDANFNKNYGYMYQFDQTLEELRVLSILEKEDAEAFEERSRFFTPAVVDSLCKQYMRQLKKYIQKSRTERKRTCKGEEYVKLAKYGNVFVKDLQRRVYQPMEFFMKTVMESGNYTELYKNFYNFYRALNKLPFETPKCPEWKTAFRASGSYFTLLNLIRFHQVRLEGCITAGDSENVLKVLLNTYKGEYWRFHELLKKTVYDNHFDLAKSIEAHKNN